MLIWRIASEILPTRTVAAHKLGLGDISCPLCLDSKESIVHLFLKCLVSRAIWFGLRWAIHSSQFMVTNNKDIIKMVCDPPIIVEPYSSSNCLKDHTTIQFSNTLDFIWNLRNQVVHNGFKFNISGTIQQLEARIEENIRSLEDIEPDVVGTRLLNVKWIAPNVGTIKLNVDAAISKGKAVITVVARNHHGDLIKAWARQTKPLDPTLVEATAINWALEIALGDNFNYICIESDAKVCIDALFSKSEDFLQFIHAQTSYSLELFLHFHFCTWVRRDANQLAHKLAKVACSMLLPFSCNLDSIPPSAKEAWSRDMLLLSF